MDRTLKSSFTVSEDEQLVEMIRMHKYLYDLQHPLHNEQLTRLSAWREISQILERPVEDCKRRWKNIKDAHRRRKKIGNFAFTGNGKSPLIKMLSFLDNVQGRQRKLFVKSNTIEKNIHKNLEMKNRCHNPGSASSTTIKTENNHIESEIYNLESDDSIQQNAINESIIDSDATEDFPDPLSLLQQRRTTGEQIQDQHENDETQKHCSLKENTLNVMQKDLEKLKRIVDRQEDSVDLFFRSLSMSVKNLEPHLINEAKVKMLQLVIDLENQNNYRLTDLNDR